jgi:hypothetical protein
MADKKTVATNSSEFVAIPPYSTNKTTKGLLGGNDYSRASSTGFSANCKFSGAKA